MSPPLQPGQLGHLADSDRQTMSLSSMGKHSESDSDIASMTSGLPPVPENPRVLRSTPPLSMYAVEHDSRLFSAPRLGTTQEVHHMCREIVTWRFVRYLSLAPKAFKSGLRRRLEFIQYAGRPSDCGGTVVELLELKRHPAQFPATLRNCDHGVALQTSSTIPRLCTAHVKHSIARTVLLIFRRCVTLRCQWTPRTFSHKLLGMSPRGLTNGSAS